MKVFYSFSLIFLILSSVIAQNATTSKIDEVFNSWNKSDEAGGSVGVIREGNLVYQNNFGMANLEHDIPIASNTIFNVGSVSKTFTAMCVMLVQQDGLIDIDSPISQYMDDLPSYTDSITIRQLLNHTSGIRDYLVLHSLSPNGIKYERDALVDQDIAQIIHRQKGLDFESSTKHSYSNTGYWLLGQLIERVTGKRLSEFAKERIFLPLKMTSTQFRDDKWVLIKNRATGYWVDQEGSWLFDGAHTQIVGPNGVYTSMDDLTKWNNAFYRKGIFGNEIREEMTSKSILKGGGAVDYGLGLEIGDYKEGLSYGHKGATFGFLAIQWYYPEYDIGIIILANRNDAFGMRQRADRIVDVLTGHAQVHNKSMNEFTRVKVSKTRQERLVGHYWNEDDYANREITFKDNKLMYSIDDRNRFPLTPIGDNSYILRNGAQMLSFKKVGEGYRMYNIVNNDTLTYQSYEKSNYTKKALSEFMGMYYSSEVGSNIKVTLGDEGLMWQIESNTYLDVFEPLKPDVFQVIGGVVFEFVRDEQEEIVGFYYRNTRANGMFFEKKSK